VRVKARVPALLAQRFERFEVDANGASPNGDGDSAGE
jgi:hypothetical protein